MAGTRSALIVASDEYTDAGLRQLHAPASDARALAAVLHDPQIGGFEVRTSLNEPAHEVNLAVEEFFADRQPDDLLLLHFSCHGVKDEAGELYFAMTNTLLRRLGATAVAAEFVNRRMTRSRSRRVVLLLDCCYAGAFDRGMTARAGTGVGIQEQFGGRGRAVITASSAMEYAFEGDELADIGETAPSVFTSALVEGLATGDADRDQDGIVALDELYDYVYDKVRAATPHQTPGKWTYGVQGDLYIARRSRPVTAPAPLPPDLQQAIDHPLAGIRAGAVQELIRLQRARHAGQALAATLALERLTDDDSRSVAAAATAALATHQPPAPPAAPAAPVQAHVETARRPAPQAAKAAHPAPAPETAESAPAGAPQDAGLPESSPARPVTPSPVSRSIMAPPPAAAASAGEPQVAGNAADVSLPAAGVDHGAPQARGDRLLRVAGPLAMLGAVLLIAGLHPNREWIYALYALVLAVLAMAAGAIVLIPRTRRLIGPGLLLGLTAASTWGLLFLPIDSLRFDFVTDEGGWKFKVLAHLVLALAACLAGLALARTAEARLTPRLPESGLAWLVALLGGAGGVALLFHDLDFLSEFSSLDRLYVAPSIWVTLVAVAVPAIAAVTVPRRLGVALLAGWIASGAVLFGYYYLYDHSEEGGSGSKPIITFGVTLVALLIVTVFFARAAPTSEAERAR